MKFLNNLDLRLYQQSILGTASRNNTLVVIPTGLGKTFIAIGLASLFYEKGKVLMMAPTKPLCEQHKKTFSKFFDAEENDLLVMTGAIAPEERKKRWMQAKIFFATPQTVQNDMLRRYFDVQEFSLLIFDEAHRATGDYAYAWIARHYCGRKLALTASPASEKAKLDEICANLGVEKVEVRSSSDSDVSPYVQEKEVTPIYIELPNKLKQVKDILENVLKDRLRVLKKADLIPSIEFVRKVRLLELQGILAAQTDINREAYLHISIVAECLKIQHALTLLQTQGVAPLVSFFKKLEKQSTKTKAAKRFVTDWNIKKAILLSYEFQGEEGEHPKFEKLKELVKDYAGKRFIVFTQYRSSVKKIASVLKEMDDIIPAEFIGQSKGLSQKEQVKMIEKFRTGEVNALVCTNIGEEGLDIPAVPLGILFEPVPSALRSIQRIGRVGRTDIGKIYVLVTKDTIDEKYYWVAKHKEQRMSELLEDLREKYKGAQTMLSDFQ